MNEKQLPCNVEAEAGVLGSLLIDPDAIVVIASLLQPDDFYIEAHRTIYQSVRDLYEAGGAADLITICDDLERRGSLKEIGGASFVGSVANHVPTSRNAVHYAKIVEEHATRRRLIEAAGKIAGGAHHGIDADAALEQAEKLVHDVARRRPERDNGSWAATMDEVLAELLDGVEGAGLTLGMPSGFERLDRHMVALRRKELAYVMARPGVGKTMFGGHVAYANAVRFAEMGEGCVEWFTMEMTKAQQAKRVLSSITNTNSRVLRAAFRRPDGTIDRVRMQTVVEAIRASRAQLDGYLFVRDASYTVQGLYAQLRKAVLERNCRLAIVDYFGLIQAEGSGKAGRTERMTGDQPGVEGYRAGSRHLRLGARAGQPRERAPRQPPAPVDRLPRHGRG